MTSYFMLSMVLTFVNLSRSKRMASKSSLKLQPVICLVTDGCYELLKMNWGVAETINITCQIEGCGFKLLVIGEDVCFCWSFITLVIIVVDVCPVLGHCAAQESILSILVPLQTADFQMHVVFFFAPLWPFFVADFVSPSCARCYRCSFFIKCH